jgi:hypothetical protein
VKLSNWISHWRRGVWHSGYQNVGYLKREDGELILTNHDRSKTAWIIDPPDDPEELERLQRKMQQSRKQAAIDTHRKRT